VIGQGLLDKLPAQLDAALAVAALLVRDRARDLAPSKSGKLRESIEAEANTVIVTAPYAAVVERKQPFLRPALLELRGEIARLIREYGVFNE